MINRIHSQPRIFKAGDRELILGNDTLIMGIINVTPDSFSDGGESFDCDSAVERGIQHIENGAVIIDVGGESTRPGSSPVSHEEELKRVIPVVKELSRCTSAIISIDTYKSDVAEQALRAGAHVINDISAGNFDPGMPEVARRHSAGIILMHIKGTPRDMQRNPVYKDLISEIQLYLKDAVQRFSSNGTDSANILVDPGIGFGKTLEHNLELINKVSAFKDIGAGVLLGPSRKSFLGTITGREVTDRVNGTIAAAVIGAINGADVLRVHDVKQVSDALKVTDRIGQFAGN